MLDWMQWTTPTFILFIGIISSLVGLTIWDIRSPSIPTKGFFPIPLSRGDRFFLSLVILVGTFFFFMAFLPQITNFYIALGVALVLIVLLVRFG